MTTFTQLKLLIWKNYLVQRRSVLWSLLELGLPLLFVCVLLTLRQNVQSSHKPYRDYEGFEITGTRKDFLETLDGDVIFTPCFNPFRIYYTPPTMETNQIMKDVGNALLVPVHAFPNEIEMQMNIMKEMDTLDPCSCDVYGGVVFEDGFVNKLNSVGSNLRYKIRLSNTPRNMHPHEGGFHIDQASVFSVGLGWKTGSLFAFPPQNGPRESNYSDGGKPGYWREGFLILQHAVDKAIIRMLTNSTELDNYKVSLRRFAYPPYNDNGFTTVIQQHLPVVLLLSYAFSVVYISRSIVADKEMRLREFMRVMGLTTFNHALAHFLINLVKLTIVSAIITLFLCAEINGKRILDKSDPTVIFFFLFVYSAMAICYCFAISSFFNSGNVVAGCAGLIWCCLYWPYFFIQPRYSSVYRSTKLITCLLANSAMSFGVQLIGIFEGQNVGLQWYNLFHQGTMYNNLSMIEIIAMLFVDSIICILLAWYVETVRPLLVSGQSLLKIFLPIFNRKLFDRNRSSRILDGLPLPAENGHNFEHISHPVRVTVSMSHVYKVFGDDRTKNVALRDFSLDLYYGQITALLGHNGAGKSTTMSILTGGLLLPNVGSVAVNGVDLLCEFGRVSRFIGYCPQYNPLFNELTVEEHLKFYCLLKQRPLIPTEVERMLQFLNLSSKRHWAACKLSGGMKRKLCVAIALIGGSEIVLLDEPTTGMDPQARHDAWKLLLEEKQYRTILLTTHFMEEADLLGDRIAVLSNGSLQCCGTSFFLKRQFGDGYRLRVIFNHVASSSMSTKVERLLAQIKAHVPNASLGSSSGIEALFVLPSIKGPDLQSLFLFLEDKQDQLDIDTFGLSIITMEEVFLRVTPSSVTSVQPTVPSLRNVCTGVQFTATEKVTGFRLCMQQFYAMIVKRALDASRNRLLIFVQVFVPVLFVVVAILVNSTLPDNKRTPPLTLSVDSYFNTIVGLYWDNESTAIGHHYASQFSSAHVVDKLSSDNFTSYVLDRVAKLDQGVFDQMCIIAAAMHAVNENNTMMTGYFNNQPLHALPASLNALDNAILRLLSNSSGIEARSITTINHPLPPTELDNLVNWWETGITEFNIAFNLVFGFSFMVSSFLVFIVRERQCGAKHLQFLSNMSLGTFWTANFLWDFFAYLLTAIAIILVFFMFHVDVLVGDSRWLHILLLLLLYGWATIPMMYFAAVFFSSAANGYVKMSIFNLLSGLLTLVTVTILLILDLVEVQKTLVWVFMAFFPNFCLGQAVSAYYFNFFIASTCDPLMAFCDFTPGAFCCQQDTFTNDALRWSRPGIGRYLFFLSMHGIVYSLLLLLTETEYPYRTANVLHNVLRSCRQHGINGWLRLKRSFDGGTQQSMNVLAESDVVAQVNDSPSKDAVMIGVKELCKRYGNFMAVKNVSFQVAKGECFGLLGINGAGKSTTFQMLCGCSRISGGNVFIGGSSIQRQWSRTKAMLGYCPQFDALFDNLTVVETLTLYARLHGISPREIKAAVTHTMEMVNLVKHADKKVAVLRRGFLALLCFAKIISICYFSGGNKRKLSLAIALIGSPPVLLLDEPTSGVDPISRRLIWQLLERVRCSGVSILLTSHSMEECEALCARLAVLVHGEVKCIGSPQQLKAKYGKGYLLIAKFVSEEYMPGFMRSIEETFPNSTIQEIHGRQMHCLIPFQASTWSRLFEVLETMVKPHGLVDYMLSQPSLEQTFMTCVGV
ncbi:ATP binding cassette sub family A [Trichuris trichiura]|uniref:ATP binding cassette sub family A n=1 Tax=Trichuris trichiura TaxID=36087 RepID=A0A077Z1D0_TRITR|nr:ATP binding cassette sub family A [Trichuris trichiura]